MLKTLKPSLPKINNDFLHVKLKKSDLENFYSNFQVKTSKIGLEYERITLDKNTFECASYEKISKIIQQFAKIFDWELLIDNETIIGAISSCGTSISLEPGGQLEISLEPLSDILEIKDALNKILLSLDNIAKAYDVMFLGYGINPKSDVDEIKLLDKKRYKIMDRYLPYAKYGELSQKMMRKTAGIQINIDYDDNIDCYNKLKFLNLISPFMSALCSNSPFENNTLTSIKSNRANIWGHTGIERCNYFYKDIFKNPLSRFNIVKSYIDKVLDVPMIFIERNKENILINGKITFAEFLKHGYLNYRATYEDYILHQSLCFPEIRLKKYIEIRCHDSAKPEMALALCAFYKGIFDTPSDILLKKFNYLKIDNLEKYMQEASYYGMNFRLDRKTHAQDVLAQLLKYARIGLAPIEREFLEPIANIIYNSKTNADLIIENKIQNTNDLIKIVLNDSQTV